MSGSSLDELHREWLKSPGYNAAYDALAEEFDLASAMIEARTAAGLTPATGRTHADDADGDRPSRKRQGQAIYNG